MSEDKAIFTSKDVIRYAAESRKVSVDSLRIPQRLLMTYQRRTFESAKNLIHGKCVHWLYGETQPFCVGKYKGTEIGLGRFWVGAPAAVMTLEEAIACRTKTILEVGLAGGLQTFLQPADIVVITEAIRDEGTSHHYFPPETTVESSRHLRNELIRHLTEGKIKHFVGPVWSTDGIYRETRSKFRRFRDKGVLAVDMETSAVFAVAKYWKISAASAQVISDVLTENGWLQAFHHESVRGSTEALLKAVLETLSES